MRTYLPVPFDEAKAANYKIHCNFYAKSGADGDYTFKYNVDDSAPYHRGAVLSLLDLNLPTDEGVYVPRDPQAGWKFDEALKLITPAADSAPHRKRARSTADDEAGGSSGAKKHAHTQGRDAWNLCRPQQPPNHQRGRGWCWRHRRALRGRLHCRGQRQVDDRRLLWQAAACYRDGGD